MKKIIGWAFALILIISFNACSINEKVSFNEDYSGHYSMTMDMSQMVVFMEEMIAEMQENFAEAAEAESEDEVEKAEEEVEEVAEGPSQAELMTAGFMSGINSGFDEAQAELDSLEQLWGVTNLAMVLDSNSTSINIDFDFPNLKSLSRFYQSFKDSMNEDPMAMEEEESKEKKEEVDWIVAKGNKLIFFGDKDAVPGEGDGSDEMMPGMNASITMTSEYNFAKKVKSVDHKFAKIDGKKVVISYTLEEMDEHKLAQKDFEIVFE